MKVPPILAVLPAFLALSLLPAQEPASSDAGLDAATATDDAATGTTSPDARTCIPHPLVVPDFTPPVPVVRQPPPSVRIHSSVTLPSPNGRTLTLQRGEPSTEPDLPPPPPPPPYVEPREPTPEEIARRVWNLRHHLNLGATIYDHKVSVVHWIDPISHESYEAVCGFDIGLLAGVGPFIHNGETYRFNLVHSHYDTTRWRRFASQWRVKIPEVAGGEILITRGNVEDGTATAPITIVKDIIAVEQDRLIPYQAARTEYQKAHAAWHAAHPPAPRDETFIFRPHRGSRYLPKP